MKTITPIRSLVVTLADLLPTGEELMYLAYESMAGDEATSPEGRHAGRNPDRLDTGGLSKRTVYERALANDLDWFDAQAAAIRANPFTWLPSLRTMVPKDRSKPSKGTRPIDDPPEIKRLVALFVRARLREKLHFRFTLGQMGSRPGSACTRKGATAQDHVAVAILHAVREGQTWCVLLDLQDAFGRVPEALALREFGRMGLTDEAARFFWNLVRIFAVTDRAGTVITRTAMGIEQGNPLSASVMDLVLAPVLRRTEARHRVRPFSYLDDIYLLCPSEQVAHGAYDGFRAIAEGLGFHNVRDLWVGIGEKGKNSEIVDTTVTPVRVLKLYEIDSIGISADPEKVAKYLADLRADGKQFHQMALPETRRNLNSQALTARATRIRNPSLVRPPRRSGNDRLPPPSVIEFRSKANLVTVADEEPKYTPVEESDTCNRVRAAFNGGTSGVLSRYFEGDHQEGCRLHDDGLQPLDTDNLADEGVGVTVRPGVECPLLEDTHGVPGGRLLVPPRGAEGHHGVHLQDDDGFACSSRCNQAGGVSLLRAGDSSRSDGPDQPREGVRAVTGDRPAPRFLLLEDPAVQAALRARHGVKIGVAHKGAVLDLTGLDEVLGEAGVLPDVVNSLVKAVRAQCRATVVIDPAEPWTTMPGILGNIGDKVYDRWSVEKLPDGRMTVTLVHRPRRTERADLGHRDLPRGADAVLAVRCVNAALGTYGLRVREDGVFRPREVQVTVPSTAAGTVAAIAKWVASRTGRTGRTVALPAKGHLAAVVTMLVEGKCESPNIDYGDAVRKLLAAKRWRQEGDWAIGDGLGHHRAVAASEPP